MLKQPALVATPVVTLLPCLHKRLLTLLFLQVLHERNVVFFTSFSRVDARALRTEAVVAVDALVVVVVRVALLLATHDGNFAALQTEYRHFTRVQAFGVLKDLGSAEAAQFVVELIGEIALDLILANGPEALRSWAEKVFFAHSMGVY